jgi:hypothetical protein
MSRRPRHTWAASVPARRRSLRPVPARQRHGRRVRLDPVLQPSPMNLATLLCAYILVVALEHDCVEQEVCDVLSNRRGELRTLMFPQPRNWILPARFWSFHCLAKSGC